MRGLNDEELALLRDIASESDFECSGECIPYSEREAAISSALLDRGLVYNIPCTAPDGHFNVTPSGRVAITCTLAAAGRLEFA